ncbi:sensor histidine kinase [Edaphobacter aggregans]|uniref:sensor histidine kinase n=1 Tax=Edaphobacter aggregans TaxID=570835 RepID=UPI000A00D805|nr:HAMP domain-containing sensor histidine kinase [Edaphobacter aggregans]
MPFRTSITRRLIASVLLLELSAALALIAAITVNEYRIQYKVFDANMRSHSSAIFGAVQDADDKGDNVVLDSQGFTLPDASIYKATDDRGRVLGFAGQLPQIPIQEGTFVDARIEGRSYRFFVFGGDRIIDPEENGGIHHHITVVYGQPVGHVWHEILEAIRFFAIATAILLSVTTLLLIWLIRRSLSPIHALAAEAEKITAKVWQFVPPAGATTFVELRPLALAIEKTIARLQRSFEQQKRFTSDAAHELKTDLAIVKSSLQLLSMKRRTPDEYARGLELALDDFTRLENTVQKMLTLARLEQAQSKGQSCRFDEALLDAVHQSAPFAALRHINVGVSPLTPATVELDRRDASLLCSNIVLNALQHSPERGTVEVKMTVDHEQIHLSVRDLGEGIRSEDQQFLFEPFYRGDPSRSRKSGGTGLGLSICKAICDHVAGSISIANHPDGGAIVSVLLPVLTAPSTHEVSASFKARR